MSFTDEMLDELRRRLENELSYKRFEHTLGVEKAALSIAEYFPDLPSDEVSAAALLHDVAKELSSDEQRRLAETSGIALTRDELVSPQVLHAFAAPGRILEGFKEFATPSVISAVWKHTTGDENMDIFDKIIFVADYVESGRTYHGCIRVREQLFSDLSRAKGREECVRALNKACLEEIDETISSLSRRGQKIDARTLKARSVIASII